jgi:hypothetical protein
MEATLMWTGIAVGGMVLVPFALDFFKRNLTIFFGMVVMLLLLYLMAPYSPEMRSFWAPIAQMPEDFASGVIGFFR